MTLEGMGYAGDLTAPLVRSGGLEVRATRIELGRTLGAGPPLPLRTELWVGGADTTVGEPVCSGDLEGAWVVDCAGELPVEMKDAAALWIPRVFGDIEQEPPDYARTRRLASTLADAISAAGGPPRLYVMCKQGFNRSGLVAGRILRELGVPPSTAVELLQQHRPGALSNLEFCRLVMD